MDSLDKEKILFNITDKKSLENNLSFAAFFIAVYESFSCYVTNTIENFYFNNDEYKRLIKNRVVDEDGNKNILKASLLWFVDEGAITMDEYEKFLEFKTRRNNFAHQLTNVIFNGVTEEDAVMFFQMFELYQKIEKWWINEIVIPSSGEILPDSYDPETVRSVLTELYNHVIEILFRDRLDEVEKYINKQRINCKGDSDETPI